MTTVLPPAFSSLQDLVDEWALPTQRARMQKRYDSSYEEIQAFYNRMMSALPSVLKYLDKIAPDNMSASDELLLKLTLSMGEVSIAVEKVKGVRNPATWPGEKMEFVHEK
jgi:hypothetical protein